MKGHWVSHNRSLAVWSLFSFLTRIYLLEIHLCSLLWPSRIENRETRDHVAWTQPRGRRIVQSRSRGKRWRRRRNGSRPSHATACRPPISRYKSCWPLQPLARPPHFFHLGLLPLRTRSNRHLFLRSISFSIRIPVPTDIWTAARRGDVDLLRVLIEEEKNDINQGDEDGSTPLHWAAYFDRYDPV